MKNSRAYFTPGEWAILGVLCLLLCVILTVGGVLILQNTDTSQPQPVLLPAPTLFFPTLPPEWTPYPTSVPTSTPLPRPPAISSQSLGNTSENDRACSTTIVVDVHGVAATVLVYAYLDNTLGKPNGTYSIAFFNVCSGQHILEASYASGTGWVQVEIDVPEGIGIMEFDYFFNPYGSVVVKK